MDTQTNLFEMMYEPYKITKPIRLIELFGGIGSQAKALENLNANFEHYRLIEFDKYPVASYNAIHGTHFEPKDITKIKAEDLGIVETDKYEYIMTYSFPCQDLSLAGKQRGMAKGSGTRSGLLWEVERLLSECKELPQILLMENVPDVIGKKNISDFQQWQLFLEKLGYKNYVEILNAKDYGIPQNRRRCFMISLLGDYSYTFPDKQVLNLRLKDMLEPQVDEKYCGHDASRIVHPDGIAPTVKENHGTVTATVVNDEINPKLVGGFGEKKSNGGTQWYQQDRIYDSETIAMAHPANLPGGSYKYLVKDKLGNEILLYKDTKQLRETIQNCELEQGKVLNLDLYNRASYEESQTITEPHHNSQRLFDGLRIRKLTPKECYRLMGFSDSDFDKASKFNSNAQLYKQAGNSIVVNVLEAIFKQLL